MELVETHHNQKQDAPSGTAKALLEIMNPEGEFKEVYGRQGMVGARQKEIGVHALRGEPKLENIQFISLGITKVLL